MIRFAWQFNVKISSFPIHIHTHNAIVYCYKNIDIVKLKLEILFFNQITIIRKLNRQLAHVLSYYNTLATLHTYMLHC